MTPTTKLLELARKATPGEWLVNYPYDQYSWICSDDAEPGNIVCCAPDTPKSFTRWPDTSAFIAAANPSAIIALVERCDRAEEQRDALLDAGKRGLACLIGAGCEHSEPVRRLRAAIALCEPGEVK